MQLFSQTVINMIMIITLFPFFCHMQWFQGVTFSPLQLLKDSKTVCGFHLRQVGNYPELLKSGMKHLFELYTEGKIKPHIDEVFALEEVSGLSTSVKDLITSNLHDFI